MAEIVIAYNSVQRCGIDRSVAISANVLMSVSNDLSAAQITYEVTTLPSYGTILLSGTPVTLFTQQDINDTKVFYAQNGAEATEDEFGFEVRGPGADPVSWAHGFSLYHPALYPNLIGAPSAFMYNPPIVIVVRHVRVIELTGEVVAEDPSYMARFPRRYAINRTFPRPMVTPPIGRTVPHSNKRKIPW